MSVELIIGILVVLALGYFVYTRVRGPKTTRIEYPDYSGGGPRAPSRDTDAR